MRNSYYADQRDVVKWGTLVHLAHREKLTTIVQVAMFVEEPAIKLKTSSGNVDVPKPVWAHFRDLRAIKRLQKGTGLKIIVQDMAFDASARSEYFRRIAEELRQLPGRKAVLLDPDTGLAKSRPSARHVSADEVRLVWEAIRKGDWLLLYQHAWRQQGWEKEAKRRFTSACGASAVESFRAAGKPRDVAVLAAERR